LDEEALCKIRPYVDRNEASLLHVFDVNRVRIQEAASLLIRGGGRIIIDCRRRINWNRSNVEENMARGDRHGNREAKKLKPKEIAPERPCFD
jgi:hypothetical protein